MSIKIPDPINPDHYKFPSGVEVIDLSEHLTSNAGQAVQYLARACRLDGRVNKLEHKVGKLEIIIEHKDSEIDRSRNIIRQAYTCKIPPEECPVLCKRAEFEEQEKAEREKAGGSADPDDCEATNEEEVGDGSN